MTPITDNLLSAEDVMDRIRRRIGLETGHSSAEAPRVAAPHRTGQVPRARVLRPPPPSKPEYSLGDLLPYDDVEFVGVAYQVILGRAIDALAQHYVQALRDGSLTKIEVLGAIRWSPEGLQRGVHINGLLIPYKLRRWRRLPLLGPALAWGHSIFQLGRLFDRQATHAANIAAFAQQTASTLNAAADELEGRLRSIEHVVDGLPGTAVIDELRHHQNLLSESIALLEIRIGEAATAYDELRSRLEVALTRMEALDGRDGELDTLISGLGSNMHELQVGLEADRLELTQLKKRLQPIRRDRDLDGLYAAFEDQFRGERELVRQRVAQYLDFVRAVGGGVPNAPVLDLGCGRGEWLDLLRDNGFLAKGVDLNRVFIESCRSKGLHVVDGDAISVLRGMESGSVGVVSLIHLAEHLEFPFLIELLDETYRVLKPGGGLIVETPNPENALVSRIGFYMDPTHRNPLPPEMLRWVIQARGFFGAEIARLTQGRLVQTADYVVDEVPAAKAINELLAPSHAALDYAVLARKPIEA